MRSATLSWVVLAATLLVLTQSLGKCIPASRSALASLEGLYFVLTVSFVECPRASTFPFSSLEGL